MRRCVRFLIALDNLLEILVFAGLAALRRNARQLATVALVGAVIAATLPRPQVHRSHGCRCMARRAAALGLSGALVRQRSAP